MELEVRVQGKVATINGVDYFLQDDSKNKTDETVVMIAPDEVLNASGVAKLWNYDYNVTLKMLKYLKLKGIRIGHNTGNKWRISREVAMERFRDGSVEDAWECLKELGEI